MKSNMLALLYCVMGVFVGCVFGDDSSVHLSYRRRPLIGSPNVCGDTCCQGWKLSRRRLCIKPVQPHFHGNTPVATRHQRLQDVTNTNPSKGHDLSRSRPRPHGSLKSRDHVHGKIMRSQNRDQESTVTPSHHDGQDSTTVNPLERYTGSQLVPTETIHDDDLVKHSRAAGLFNRQRQTASTTKNIFPRQRPDARKTHGKITQPSNGQIPKYLTSARTVTPTSKEPRDSGTKRLHGPSSRLIPNRFAILQRLRYLARLMRSRQSVSHKNQFQNIAKRNQFLSQGRRYSMSPLLPKQHSAPRKSSEKKGPQKTKVFRSTFKPKLSLKSKTNVKKDTNGKGDRSLIHQQDGFQADSPQIDLKFRDVNKANKKEIPVKDTPEDRKKTITIPTSSKHSKTSRRINGLSAMSKTISALVKSRGNGNLRINFRDPRIRALLRALAAKRRGLKLKSPSPHQQNLIKNSQPSSKTSAREGSATVQNELQTPRNIHHKNISLPDTKSKQQSMSTEKESPSRFQSHTDFAIGGNVSNKHSAKTVVGSPQSITTYDAHNFTTTQFSDKTALPVASSTVRIPPQTSQQIAYTHLSTPDLPTHIHVSSQTTAVRKTQKTTTESDVTEQDLTTYTDNPLEHSSQNSETETNDLGEVSTSTTKPKGPLHSQQPSAEISHHTLIFSKTTTSPKKQDTTQGSVVSQQILTSYISNPVRLSSQKSETDTNKLEEVSMLTIKPKLPLDLKQSSPEISLTSHRDNPLKHSSQNSENNTLLTKYDFTPTFKVKDSLDTKTTPPKGSNRKKTESLKYRQSRTQTDSKQTEIKVEDRNNASNLTVDDSTKVNDEDNAKYETVVTDKQEKKSTSAMISTPRQRYMKSRHQKNLSATSKKTFAVFKSRHNRNLRINLKNPRIRALLRSLAAKRKRLNSVSFSQKQSPRKNPTPSFRRQESQSIKDGFQTPRNIHQNNISEPDINLLQQPMPREKEFTRKQLQSNTDFPAGNNFTHRHSVKPAINTAQPATLQNAHNQTITSHSSGETPSVVMSSITADPPQTFQQTAHTQQSSAKILHHTTTELQRTVSPNTEKTRQKSVISNEDFILYTDSLPKHSSQNYKTDANKLEEVPKLTIKPEVPPDALYDAHNQTTAPHSSDETTSPNVLSTVTNLPHTSQQITSMQQTSVVNPHDADMSQSTESSKTHATRSNSPASDPDMTPYTDNPLKHPSQNSDTDTDKVEEISKSTFRPKLPLDIESTVEIVAATRAGVNLIRQEDEVYADTPQNEIKVRDGNDGSNMNVRHENGASNIKVKDEDHANEQKISVVVTRDGKEKSTTTPASSKKARPGHSQRAPSATLKEISAVFKNRGNRNLRFNLRNPRIRALIRSLVAKRKRQKSISSQNKQNSNKNSQPFYRTTSTREKSAAIHKRFQTPREMNQNNISVPNTKLKQQSISTQEGSASASDSNIDFPLDGNFSREHLRKAVVDSPLSDTLHDAHNQSIVLQSPGETPSRVVSTTLHDKHNQKIPLQSSGETPSTASSSIVTDLPHTSKRFTEQSSDESSHNAHSVTDTTISSKALETTLPIASNQDLTSHKYPLLKNSFHNIPTAAESDSAPRDSDTSNEEEFSSTRENRLSLNNPKNILTKDSDVSTEPDLSSVPFKRDQSKLPHYTHMIQTTVSSNTQETTLKSVVSITDLRSPPFKYSSKNSFTATEVPSDVDSTSKDSGMMTGQEKSHANPKDSMSEDSDVSNDSTLPFIHGEPLDDRLQSTTATTQFDSSTQSVQLASSQPVSTHSDHSTDSAVTIPLLVPTEDSDTHENIPELTNNEIMPKITVARNLPDNQEPYSRESQDKQHDETDGKNQERHNTSKIEPSKANFTRNVHHAATDVEDSYTSRLGSYPNSVPQHTITAVNPNNNDNVKQVRQSLIRHPAITHKPPNIAVRRRRPEHHTHFSYERWMSRSHPVSPRQHHRGGWRVRQQVRRPVSTSSTTSPPSTQSTDSFHTDLTQTTTTGRNEGMHTDTEVREDRRTHTVSTQAPSGLNRAMDFVVSPSSRSLFLITTNIPKEISTSTYKPKLSLNIETEIQKSTAVKTDGSLIHGVHGFQADSPQSDIKLSDEHNTKEQDLSIKDTQEEKEKSTAIPISSKHDTEGDRQNVLSAPSQEVPAVFLSRRNQNLRINLRDPRIRAVLRALAAKRRRLKSKPPTPYIQNPSKNSQPSSSRTSTDEGSTVIQNKLQTPEGIHKNNISGFTSKSTQKPMSVEREIPTGSQSEFHAERNRKLSGSTVVDIPRPVSLQDKHNRTNTSQSSGETLSPVVSSVVTELPNTSQQITTEPATPIPPITRTVSQTTVSSEAQETTTLPVVLNHDPTTFKYSTLQFSPENNQTAGKVPKEGEPDTAFPQKISSLPDLSTESELASLQPVPSQNSDSTHSSLGSANNELSSKSSNMVTPAKNKTPINSLNMMTSANNEILPENVDTITPTKHHMTPSSKDMMRDDANFPIAGIVVESVNRPENDDAQFTISRKKGPSRPDASTNDLSPPSEEHHDPTFPDGEQDYKQPGVENPDKSSSNVRQLSPSRHIIDLDIRFHRQPILRPPPNRKQLPPVTPLRRETEAEPFQRLPVDSVPRFGEEIPMPESQNTVPKEPNTVTQRNQNKNDDENARQSAPHLTSHDVTTPSCRGQFCENELNNVVQESDRQNLKERGSKPLDVACPPGHRPTLSGQYVVCEPLTASVDGYAADHLCEPGQVLVKAGNTYYCQQPDEIIPSSIQYQCPQGEKPYLSKRGPVCVPEMFGGVISSTPSSARQLCPLGMTAVESSVGVYCLHAGYFPSLSTSTTTTTTASLTDTDGDDTEDKIRCPDGMIRITTQNGEMCGFKAGLHENVKCPKGQVLKWHDDRYECKPHDLLTDVDIRCPAGQTLVKTSTGTVCHHNQPKLAINVLGYYDCADGEILTQTSSGFFCRNSLRGSNTNPDSLSENLPQCPPSTVAVKLTTGDLECVRQNEANLKCADGMELKKTSAGFFCQRKVHDMKNCKKGEILLLDGDQSFCQRLNRNGRVCENGHKPQMTEEGLLCKAHFSPFNCPSGFYLSKLNGNFSCLPLLRSVNICKDSSFVRAYGNRVVCHKGKLSGVLVPCEDGYVIAHDKAEPACELENFVTISCQSDVNGTVPSCLVQKSPCQEKCKDGAMSGKKSCREIRLEALQGCHPRCANGGSCLEGRCHCPAGVTGTACQEDIDECKKLPVGYCQHGCQNLFGSFRCTCPRNATMNADGRTCQAKECIPRCMNGGHCEGGVCVCAAGYTGPHCQEDVDECHTGEARCQQQCLNTMGSFTCLCPPGSRLSPDLRTCINTTCIPECRNRGQCENHRCQCPSGFTGFICQLDINECRGNHGCSHQCTNSYGSYRCTCPPGFFLENDRKTCTEDVSTKG